MDQIPVHYHGARRGAMQDSTVFVHLRVGQVGEDDDGKENMVGWQGLGATQDVVVDHERMVLQAGYSCLGQIVCTGKALLKMPLL
jgi:hypothetical protein